MLSVIVLYEDQRGSTNGFGLHQLVCQWVLDQLQRRDSVHDLQKRDVVGVPVKGRDNLIKRCRKDLPNLRRTYKRVLALVDEDKLHEVLKLSSNSCRRQLRESLLRRCESPEGLEIVLLRENLESVLLVVQQSGLTSIAAATFTRAIEKKVMKDRDSVFIQCAKLEPAQRAELLKKLPDLERLVERIAAALQPSPSS